MGLGFGMIFAPAINTATAGVAREDSGVASALVNTMQQVGGSIGTSALSTIALTATTSYLAAHHTGPAALAQATAAVHGYTLAFTVSAGTARGRRDPRDHPAAVPPPARGAQEPGRGRRFRARRARPRTRPGIGSRPRTRIRAGACGGARRRAYGRTGRGPYP